MRTSMVCPTPPARSGLATLALAALLGWGCSRPAPQSTRTSDQIQAANSGSALLLTDIHLNPLDGASNTNVDQLAKADIDDWPAILGTFQQGFSSIGSDPNYPFVDSALAEAAKHRPFDYVVFTGDMLVHDFRNKFPLAAEQFPAFARKTAAFVARQLRTRFSNVPVFVAIGNNDSDGCDYGSTPNGKFLGAVADEMTVLKTSADANQDFRSGGYFTLPHPTVAGQDIIVLNSVFWSTSYFDPNPPYNCTDPPPGDPGSDELNWLESTLQTASKNRHGVTFVMHIPPGVDPHSGDKAQSFWKAQYFSRFSALMKKYSGMVQVALAGHTHFDDFRVFDDFPAGPWRITPAVSPKFGNNPGFSVLSYDSKTATISDIATFFASPPRMAWAKEYNFNKAYNLSGFSATNLQTLNQDVRKGNTNFEQYYMVGAGFNWTRDLKYVACAESFFTHDNARTCITGWPSAKP